MPESARLEETELRLATRLVRGGVRRTGHQETSEGLFLTSGYVYASAEEAEAAFVTDGLRYVYSRFANPTVKIFEEKLRLVEGAEACRAVASGMAAVAAALLCQLRAGDRVVASRALFGSCWWIIAELLPRYGIATEFVAGENLDAWRAALAKPTKAVFVETPSNPTMTLVDLAELAKLTRAAGAALIVDNVFATPLLQRPLELGADIVVYSATKHIDGQGRCLGGAVLGSASFIDTVLGPYLRHTGPALSPFNAWTLLKGLETLDVRLERHNASALRLARFLEDHPRVRKVYYPFLDSHPQAALARRQMRAGGSIVSFEIKGGKAAAFRFLDALSLIDISNNLGDAKSLVTHPWTTTHARIAPEEKLAQGITEELVRLSVGLEDPEDLEADLGRALNA
ncbi:MAG: O-succinylhomoserine sulfhydrylase [Rhodospirillales bacterium]|nr:O-succinylhomoserine sulfhydrylase [Rhodospirillales bacterium]